MHILLYAICICVCNMYNVIHCYIMLYNVICEYIYIYTFVYIKYIFKLYNSILYYYINVDVYM